MHGTALCGSFFSHEAASVGTGSGNPTDKKIEAKMTEVVKLAAIVFLVSATAAQAYVDPGSGSAIITTVLGIFAAIGYTFRKYFYRLKRKLVGTSGEDDPSASS